MEGQSCFIVFDYNNYIVFGCFQGHVYIFDKHYKFIKHIQLKNGGIYAIKQFNERFLIFGQVDSWIDIVDMENLIVHQKIEGD